LVSQAGRVRLSILLARIVLVLLIAGAVIGFLPIAFLMSSALPPRWTVSAAPVVMWMLMGPFALPLVAHVWVWPLSLAVTAIAICLARSWYIWRKSPDSEAFAVPLAVAMGLWITSAFFSWLLL